MAGTRPTFYLVPVTQALSTAVVAGQYPEAPTEVVKYFACLGHDSGSTGNEVMETPEYRRVAFQQFFAFKRPCKGMLADNPFLTDVIRVDSKANLSEICPRTG
jgi:hypothetical protein